LMGDVGAPTTMDLVQGMVRRIVDDLLAVMRFEGSRRRQAAAIDLALANRKVALDLILVTPDELERDRDQVGTIVRPALLEGRVLYARAA
jgi:hypothetical protein